MSFSDAPISFPGLFGDWQFTVPSKALNIGNGIYWYGIIIAAGMLLGLYFCMKQAPKYGLSEDNIIDTVLWVIPFSIIGARIYYVLFYLDLFRNSDGSINWSSTYRIWDGGLAILKHNNGRCLREFFCYEGCDADKAYFISTYQGDGTPLPTFAGEPMEVSVPSPEEVWDALNEDNKVSLYANVNGEVKLFNKNLGD